MRSLKYIVLGLICTASLLYSGALVTGRTKYVKFEAGDRVLFQTDFKDCPVGEFPENFDGFEGALECVKFNDKIWVAPSTDSDAKLFKKVDLGEGDFSIEFDALIYQDLKGAIGPNFTVELYGKKDKRWDAKRLPYSTSFVGYYHKCAVRLERIGKLEEINRCDKKTKHIAIQVRRGQYRVFIDGKRVVSIPFTLEDAKSVGGIKLLWIRDTNAYGVLISDIKIAKYTEEEAKPTPEKLGIGVEKTKTGMKLTVPEKVLFDFNKFILKPDAKEALSVVGDVIKENPAKQIIVTGHTDNVGDEAYNLKLSLQRAQSVADFLIYCEKIAPKLFKIVGKGESEPIADNATEEGRAKNRRVEIELVK
jgi:outer membrane protein OmpA-like peptidoglycan-associated protein